MTSPACDAFREVAPELALGIAVGEERAVALDHLAGCASCRRLLEDLTATVDVLVLTAPAAEPPSGFEVRALEAFDATVRDEGTTERPTARPGRKLALTGGSHRRWLAVAAVVAVLALATAGLVRWRGNDGSPAQAWDLAGTVETSAGVAVGEVWVDDGDVDLQETGSELVVSLGGETPVGTYRVQCDYESGGPYDAGELTVGPDGLDHWSAEVSVPTYDLHRVRLVSTAGTGNLEAEIGPG